MNIFSVELSTKFGSVAIVQDGTVIAKKQWIETYNNRQQLFDSIEETVRESRLDWNEFDCYAVGRGPGAFSGLRISLSVVNTLAQPNNKPVYSLNSGHVLAQQVFEKSGGAHITVIGDARRKQLWVGLFKHNNDTLLMEKPFSLLGVDELLSYLPSSTLVVSPDLDRLADTLEGFDVWDDVATIRPQASTLGVLVEKMIKRGIESEPLEPLYMHPPVFIEPRF